MLTNRDLYCFVSELTVEFAEKQRTLEEYLRALHALGARHADETALSLDQFASMLRDAFTSEPGPVDPAWEVSDLRFDIDAGGDGYIGWERTLASQILDLQLMARDGTLENELRYFGTEAKRPRRAKRPTSSYWHNFDPLTYIECGVVGAFGGWEVGDETGRELVPDMVAVVQGPLVELDRLDWSMLVDFLECGQLYE
jgi:hypothetical protein